MKDFVVGDKIKTINGGIGVVASNAVKIGEEDGREVWAVTLENGIPFDIVERFGDELVPQE